MSARLILIRHGESTSNVQRVATSALDGYPLTERGRSQAAEVGRALSADRVARVYSSPVERARQTAAIVAAELAAPVTVVNGLEEVDVGMHEGRPEDEATIDGATNFERWLSREDLDHGLAGGETARQVIERVSVVLRRIVGHHDDDTVAVVSHGGALALTLVQLCQNLTPQYAWEHLLDNCAVVTVVAEGEVWTCTSWARQVILSGSVSGSGPADPAVRARES